MIFDTGGFSYQQKEFFSIQLSMVFTILFSCWKMVVSMREGEGWTSNMPQAYSANSIAPRDEGGTNWQETDP